MFVWFAAHEEYSVEEHSVGDKCRSKTKLYKSALNFSIDKSTIMKCFAGHKAHVQGQQLFGGSFRLYVQHCAYVVNMNVWGIQISKLAGKMSIFKLTVFVNYMYMNTIVPMITCCFLMLYVSFFSIHWCLSAITGIGRMLIPLSFSLSKWGSSAINQ